MRRHLGILLCGVLTGAAALALTAAGNPANMGFCAACFLRDIAGACQAHAATAVSYMRPEIAGLMLGAMAMALCKGEFRARGGSSAATRFLLGMLTMVGALMFLGCPLRMLLRLGGGDLNAVSGLAGFGGGAYAGTLFLNRGFTLRRAYAQNALDGAVLPASMGLLLLLSLLFPALFTASAQGPGSMRAPVLLSLAAGLLVGAAAQRSRLCFAGGIRDAVLFKDFHLLLGPVALVVTVLLGNLMLGSFHPGFLNQPIAHTDGLWNALGMALTGLCSVLLGGCPLRQIVLSGEGSSDAAAAVAGMIAGGALCHTLNLASSSAGPTVNGQWGVAAGLIMAVVIAVSNIAKEGSSK